MYALKSSEYFLKSTGYLTFAGYFSYLTGCFVYLSCSRNSIMLPTATSLRFVGLGFSDYVEMRSVSSSFLFLDYRVIMLVASC